MMDNYWLRKIAEGIVILSFELGAIIGLMIYICVHWK